MTRELSKSLIDVAMGRIQADLSLLNCKIVDVYNKEIFNGTVYIKNGYIAGFGDGTLPSAKKEIDCEGKYLVPGFIDGHCHIESSHLSPASFSDVVVPCGTTTVIADPHEICNVAGLDALNYMLESSQDIPLSVFIMFPSCVPATIAENSGAILLADSIEKRISHPRVLGLGEMMDYPGVIAATDLVMDKLEVAYNHNKPIDGHVPAQFGKELDAYTATGILTDHECITAEDLHERVRRGMYVLLREGTTCNDVLHLVKGANEQNASRLLFCTDDRQPQSILNEGHINYAVNLAIQGGLNPLTAISIASLNAATCYGLKDRGAIAPGLRADFFLTDSIENIKPSSVFILGKQIADNGNVLEIAKHTPSHGVSRMMNVKDFSIDRLKLKLSSDYVKTIDIIPGGVVTSIGKAKIERDSLGYYIQGKDDLLKIAVIERHKGTGNVAIGLIRNYGLQTGSIAMSIAHDSHNIMAIGKTDSDMAIAVEKLISIGGGIVLVNNGEVLGIHTLEIGGLMTDRSVDEVNEELIRLHNIAIDVLKVNPKIDPFMTLCFMALPVIPEIKITDMGLFDIPKFKHVNVEWED